MPLTILPGQVACVFAWGAMPLVYFCFCNSHAAEAFQNGAQQSMLEQGMKQNWQKVEACISITKTRSLVLSFTEVFSIEVNNST